jgi:4,5-dihydroxyphthalate decarboxylase
MTPPITLRTAIGAYDHVRALKDGSIRSERVRFDFVEVEPITRAFRRMVRDLEFDICEMAIATHALAHAFGKPVTALPIVLSSGFHHGALVCPLGSTLRGPADLRGRRVAVRAYSQTTGVWVRGILRSEYGLAISDITTVTEEDAHVADYRDPAHVVRAAPGKTLRGMLLAGEVDAAIALRPADPKEVRAVIPNAEEQAAAWYRNTGVYPINHIVSAQTALLREHPWLGPELYALFSAAKARAQPQAPPASSAKARLLALVGDDPLPYGIARNRAAIEMLLRLTAVQQLTPRVYGVEELFDAGTLAT